MAISRAISSTNLANVKSFTLVVASPKVDKASTIRVAVALRYRANFRQWKYDLTKIYKNTVNDKAKTDL